MAPSRKSRRKKTRAPETPMAWKLPAEQLREIIARSDNRTLIRFAATCNLLRCDILSPPLDRRVTQGAPCILAHLCADAKKPLALVHPTTPAASSFCHKHLSRFMSRKGVGTLLAEFTPVSSRRGLVILRRRLNIEEDRPKSGRRFDMCVYDPMSGTQSFFIDPPEILSDKHRDPDYFYHHDPKYFLLTAADGIDSSFLLVIFERPGNNMKVHTASSSDTWESVAYVSDDYFPWGLLKKRGNPTILSGGVIHWLPSRGNKIISYDLGIRKVGSVKLPSTHCSIDHAGNQLYLATTSDGKMLKLLTIQGLKMFVWLQLPGGSGWSLDTEIDMQEKLRSLDPRITRGSRKRIEFEGSGKRTGEVVLLIGARSQDYSVVYSEGLIVFDLETKKMHKQKRGLSLLEIDLPSRLQTMKIFS